MALWIVESLVLDAAAQQIAEKQVSRSSAG
jgi:hypothetical protein